MLQTIQNRFVTNAFRWSLITVFAIAIFAGSGRAQRVPPAKAPLISGVYNGAYAGDQGPTKFKLSLTQQDNGALAGEFTLYVDDGSATNAYSCDVRGRYIPSNRMVQLMRGRWKTSPPRGIDMSGLNGVFDPDGNNGAGQISGKMRTRPNPDFQASRDPDESAKMATAAAKEAGPPASPVAQPATPPAGAKPIASSTTAPAGPVARLHSIDGVYNGTYAGKQGAINFKLTITQTGGGKLAGVCTVHLTVDSGDKPYTYSLDGVNDPAHHHFELYARDWDTVPPVDFESTGFDGTFAPDVAHNAAKISSSRPRFGPKFEASWNATESVDLAVTIAAQKAVGTPRVPPPTTQQLAAQAAAHDAVVKAHADAVQNAPPKQLASKDLVRKSKTYWDDYQTDLIREVFDGGFGVDIDKDRRFQMLFCAYVDMFSNKCRADLPADHQTVTVTQYTNRKFDQTGHVISQDARTFTVEVDSRFVAKYRQFGDALGSSRNGLGVALDVAVRGLSPSDIVNEMAAPARDIQRFFANHAGKSAAMRQLTENFLRGATREPSLQQAGAKIDGAEAETDKGLPPGRFARFVDGANAFYRDPANAKYGGRNDTAFCQALAESYQFKLTRDEEYYYANDFKARFYDQIMQPQEHCTDPAWSLLHPAVEECLANENK